jgi:L-cysteine S-thiosulfotransferase
MPRAGFAPSPPKRSGEAMRIAALAVLLSAICAGPVAAQEPVPYAVVGDAIPQPLTATPGEAGRGRAIVASRSVGLCLLCHGAPIAEERFQGDLAPSLAGAGTRWTAAQLRLRVVDGSHLNPDTIMPPYYRTAGLQRVARPFAGRTILSAQQVEDVVAYLTTLKE